MLKIKVAKIVGASSSSGWSQIHAFFPQPGDDKQHLGSLVAVFCLSVKQENLELSSFGTEIIQRFHELYYSGRQSSGKNLKNAVQALETEFGQTVGLGVAAAAVLGNTQAAVFLIAKEAAIKIYRAGKLTTLVKPSMASETITGPLKAGDQLVLATGQFWEKISQGQLTEALETGDNDKIKENLAALVGSREDNSLVAAAVISLSGDTNKLKIFLKERAPLAAKKMNLTLALVLIGLLLVSIFLGTRKRQLSGSQEWENKQLTEISYQYQQGLELVNINPDRAQVLLRSAKDAIAEYQKQNGTSLQVSQLSQEIDKGLEQLLHEFRQEASLFLDLSLVKPEFSSLVMRLDADSLVLLDPKIGVIINVQIPSKEGKILAGAEVFKRATRLAKIANFVFVSGGGKLVLIDEANGKIIGDKDISDLGKIDDMTGFGSSVYLLGRSGIGKFNASEEGLSDKINYLSNTGAFLGQPLSLAIDGSIWILGANSQIQKFTRGQLDNFAMGNLNKPIAQTTNLFTDKDCQNLYILDQKNTRVVVIAKSGEYKASIIWPGIAGVSDLAVSELLGKIFLLAGSRIYTLDFKP